MKQTFDLVSHFFALLPLAVLWEPARSNDRKSQILFVFLLVATICSVIYHAVSDPKGTLHTIDRFTSCTIIVLTFWLYIDDLWRWSFGAIIVVLLFVLLEANKVIDSMVIEGLVLFLVLFALCIYFAQLCSVSSDDRKYNRKYNLKDPFFGSFFLTQILAIYFFVEDINPYYHSLWHLFAFVSLGSVITHTLKSQGFEKEVAMFYLLGSLPSRLFISWIFIDWHKGEGVYVGSVFTFLALFMIIGCCVKDPSGMMTTRRKRTVIKGAVTYSIIVGLLFSENIGAAGWLLFGDTIISAGLWLQEKASWFQGKASGDKKTYMKVKTPTLKLHNMVF